MIEHLSKASAALLTCLIWIPVASALDVKRPDVRAFIDATSRDLGFPRAQLEALLAQGETLRRIADPNVAASVVGILGVETSFGRITGRYRVLDALATLAFDYP